MGIKDFRGLTIAKGDLIAYPWRHGSQMGMHGGFVWEMLRGGELDVQSLDRNRWVRILRSDRVAVLGRNW